MISLFAVNMASVLVVPRIEKYSQGAAIEFYEYLQDKDCYVETISFKKLRTFILFTQTTT